MSDEIRKSENGRKKGRAALMVVILLLIVALSVYLGYYLYGQYVARQNDDVASSIAATTTEPETSGKAATNPIDFSSLQAKNSDIFSWLKVPGTKVDYPVLQHPSDDYFYLKHDAYTKYWSASGAVYMELGNTNHYKDRVTVIYGHNGYGDSMFTTLHRFESSEFFNKHQKFYIYMPKRKLTYQIVSAFKFDDRHLLNCYDFNNTKVYRDFLSMIQAPDTNNRNVSTSLSRELTTDDKIVVLSTCFTNQPSNRYLVCGVLIKDEQTN